MKKIGLLFLAMVMVLGVAGCKKHESTVAIIGVAGDCRFYVARGRLTSIESGWQSETFSLHPGQEIRIDLPDGGMYRLYMVTERGYYWDYTEYFESETETAKYYDCG